VSRALVTGAGGFLGRFAVTALREQGLEVHGASRRTPPSSEADAWHVAHLLDPAAPAELMRAASPSHLLHLAWATEHPGYWTDPVNQDWVTATRRLVQAFAEAGGERVVLAGSCAQYDWSGNEPFSETRTPRNAATLYGQAKQEAEDWLAGTGLSFATGLVFLAYGPYEEPRHLVPSVARSLLAGEEALTTAGEQVRDYVHVADCGGALAALLASPAQGAVNVGTGQGARIADVARTVARLIEREDLLHVGAVPGDDRTKVVANTTRLRDEVGFMPRWGLEDGLRDAVDWWRQRTRRR
jgi:nucleoside-diphosphate-sugar epimerase